MEEALASLPRTLNETNQRTITYVPTELKNDAIRLLQFLVHSQRPLKLAEAKEVIATQIKSEAGGFNVTRQLFCEIDVLNYCPGLPTTVHPNDRGLHLARSLVDLFCTEFCSKFKGTLGKRNLTG
jgi:hypothetical protein